MSEAAEIAELSQKVIFQSEQIKHLEQENARLRREVEVLRFYGNKDCTAMAEEALAEEVKG